MMNWESQDLIEANLSEALDILRPLRDKNMVRLYRLIWEVEAELVDNKLIDTYEKVEYEVHTLRWSNNKYAKYVYHYDSLDAALEFWMADFYWQKESEHPHYGDIYVRTIGTNEDEDSRIVGSIDPFSELKICEEMVSAEDSLKSLIRQRDRILMSEDATRLYDLVLEEIYELIDEHQTKGATLLFQSNWVAAGAD